MTICNLIMNVYYDKDGAQPRKNMERIMNHSISRLLIAMLMLSSHTYLADVITEENDNNLSSDSNKVIATVLGKSIYLSDKKNISSIILSHLFQKYMKDNSIAPTEEEFDVFIKNSEKRENQTKNEREQERKEILKQLDNKNISKSEKDKFLSDLQMLNSLLKPNPELDNWRLENPDMAMANQKKVARSFILKWKVHKSLFDKYGGRVIFQQAGPEPIDAYRMFLEEEKKRGNFTFIDKSLEDSFWNYFKNDKIHTFYSEEEGKKLINDPWWSKSSENERETKTSQEKNGEAVHVQGAPPPPSGDKSR